jgi:hypothetical protein
LEKLAAGWLISSLIFVVLIYVLLMVVNLLTGTLISLFPGKEFIFVDPFYAPLLKSLGSYMVLQTLFLLGALYFKKNNFFKTILSVFLVALVISLWGALMAYLVVGETYIVMKNSYIPEHWKLVIFLHQHWRNWISRLVHLSKPPLKSKYLLSKRIRW